tara:strand:- start:2897 stop:3940 length:1044 start_codon:yes stop_codon:yes gene_type:complete
MSPVSDWDARSIWLFNAKIIFYENNLNNFFNYSPYYSHSDYPIFAPVLSATLATVIGDWNEIFPKFSSLIFALPPIVILTKNLKSKFSLMVFIILILFIYEKRIINGEIDALISLYSIFLLKLINDIVDKKFSDKQYKLDLILIFFSLIIITLLKVEGLAIIFCIIFSYLVIYGKSKLELTKRLIFLSLLSLLPILYWSIYSNNFVEMTSARMMLGTGERLINNLFDFKFILYLINKILINKQMVITILVFVFVFSKCIIFNEKKNIISFDKIIFNEKIKFCFLTIFLYSVILAGIMIMSEGSAYNVPIKYFMADTAADRYFAPIQSMMILCTIYFLEAKKIQQNFI